MIFCMFKYLGLWVIGPLILNSQEIILSYAWGCKQVCIIMQLRLDPMFFTTHKSTWHRLSTVEYSIGKQSLSTQTIEQVVDEKSLTSVKLQSVIEHFFFFLNSFEIALVTFLLMSLKTLQICFLLVFTSVLLEGLKFMQSQLRLVFHTSNQCQKRLQMGEIDI